MTSGDQLSAIRLGVKRSPAGGIFPHTTHASDDAASPSDSATAAKPPFSSVARVIADSAGWSSTTRTGGRAAADTGVKVGRAIAALRCTGHMPTTAEMAALTSAKERPRSPAPPRAPKPARDRYAD